MHMTAPIKTNLVHKYVALCTVRKYCMNTKNKDGDVDVSIMGFLTAE